MKLQISPRNEEMYVYDVFMYVQILSAVKECVYLVKFPFMVQYISYSQLMRAAIVAIMLLDKLVKRKKNIKTYFSKTSLTGLQIMVSLLVCFSGNGPHVILRYLMFVLKVTTLDNQFVLVNSYFSDLVSFFSYYLSEIYIIISKSK